MNTAKKSVGNHRNQPELIVHGFRQCPSLDILDDSALRDLAASAILRHYKKGEFILQEGDPSIFYQLVIKGRVKLFKQSSSGKNFIIGIISVGQSINASVLFDESPHFMSAQAMEPVTIIRVLRASYLKMLSQNPHVFPKIIDILNKVMNSTYERFTDMVGARVEQRLCNVLNMLMERFGTELKFTNEEIASLGGMTQESAVRIMTKLKERQVIASVGRGKLRVLKPQELKNLSRGPFYI